MKTLAQLRAEQKALGLVAPRDDEELPMTAAALAKAADTLKRDNPGDGVIRLPVTVGSPDTRGFLKLLPPGVFVADVKFVQEFWAGPSPWCRVEGMPDHPDFGKNLEAFENGN